LNGLVGSRSIALQACRPVVVVRGGGNRGRCND